MSVILLSSREQPPAVAMLARPLLSSQRSEEKSWFEKVLARTTRKQQIAAIVVLAGVSALFLSSIIFLISRATTRLGYASSNAILSVDKYVVSGSKSFHRRCLTLLQNDIHA